MALMNRLLRKRRIKQETDVPTMDTDYHNWHDKRHKEFASQAECPLCNTLMSSRIYQCNNGHSICSECYNQLRNSKPKCPTCKSTLIVPHRSLEQLLELLEIPCPHDGCDFVGLVQNVKTHKNSCPHRPRKCPETHCEGFFF